MRIESSVLGPFTTEEYRRVSEEKSILCLPSNICKKIIFTVLVFCNTRLPEIFFFNNTIYIFIFFKWSARNG